MWKTTAYRFYDTYLIGEHHYWKACQEGYEFPDCDIDTFADHQNLFEMLDQWINEHVGKCAELSYCESKIVVWEKKAAAALRMILQEAEVKKVHRDNPFLTHL